MWRHGQGVGGITELLAYIVCKYMFGRNAKNSWVGDFSCIDKMCLVYFWLEGWFRLFLSSLSQKNTFTLDSLYLHKPSFLRNCFLTSLLARLALTFTSVAIKVDSGLAYEPQIHPCTWDQIIPSGGPGKSQKYHITFLHCWPVLSQVSILILPLKRLGGWHCIFFKGHSYWQLIYLSGEMRLDIKTNINSWVFNRDALSAGVIEMTLMTLSAFWNLDGKESNQICS